MFDHGGPGVGVGLGVGVGFTGRGGASDFGLTAGDGAAEGEAAGGATCCANTGVAHTLIAAHANTANKRGLIRYFTLLVDQ